MTAERIARRFTMAGRRALVTGGSLSIGRAIVLAFADAGADVAIHSAAAADAAFGRPDAAAETAAEVQQRGRRAIVVDSDFEVSGEGRRTIRAATAALGVLDVLVVCASIQYRTPFEQVSAQEVERQIPTNFSSTIDLLHEVVATMKAQR